MSTIAFWSPFAEMGCSSSALMSAYATAFQYKARVLLVNTGPANCGVESGIIQDEKSSTEKSYSFEENGWDAVERLFISGSLNKHNLKDYTKPLLKERLDLLTGSVYGNERSAIEKGELIKKLLEIANQCYDLVLLDADQSNVNSQLILQQADVVVVVLNQNMRNLEHFFEKILPEQITERKLHVLINKYDSNSRATLANIKRGFRYKGSLSAVPYTTGYLDAINRRDVPRYLQLESLTEKKQVQKGSFASSMAELACLIMDGAGMRTVLKRLERGA
ncbi:CO dehydrogenase nickel-insertion accessory protein CooC1 [Paenibacillus sp. 4624]|jgi:CO dehydrogenase nickel-insertion accessory protein CooC1|uniref:AAA domain-containing protein n=1 Tax=Paenibacillus amylolyticus TaxID=1451 RepID=A0A5M9WWE9_PAEAM|nr:hypothetical protein [Paenibacillus amylolyticus]KAA8785980.1 hypothetical protein EC604_19265 [Paenibacillus amylolyticus]